MKKNKICKQEGCLSISDTYFNFNAHYNCILCQHLVKRIVTINSKGLMKIGYIYIK